MTAPNPQPELREQIAALFKERRMYGASGFVDNEFADRILAIVGEHYLWPVSHAEDGTDRLCRALYGRDPEPRDYLGGSEAKMLHDAANIIGGLRDQFATPGHRLDVGQPGDSGGDMTAVYERYPDNRATLWARFNSSSDAEAVVNAINIACER